MSDRGFEITNILPPGIGLYISQGSRAQLTAEEMTNTCQNQGQSYQMCRLWRSTQGRTGPYRPRQELVFKS